MPSFTVLPLTDEEIATAFALARMAAPAIGLADWSRFVERLKGQGGGLVGAFSPDRMLHGIATFRIDETLRGAILRVDTFVTFELSTAAPARGALMATLERTARLRGLGQLAVALPARGYVSESGGKAAGWTRYGLEFESVIISKKVDDPARCRPFSQEKDVSRRRA